MRVIDVRLGMVKDAPEGYPYAALSYVWGPPPHLKLMNSNYEQLTAEGVLYEVFADLSPSVKDGLIFCEKNRINFLWVDALCINQDDRDDRRANVENMVAIYSQAVSVIARVSLLSENVEEIFGDFNELNIVDVTTSEETTNRSLDWGSTSPFTSPASSNLGSTNDESLALNRPMVPKKMETSYDALSRASTRTLSTGDHTFWISNSTNRIIECHYTGFDKMYACSYHESRPEPILRAWKAACIMRFPTRLFGQPILMRHQRIFDPG